MTTQTYTPTGRAVNYSGLARLLFVIAVFAVLLWLYLRAVDKPVDAPQNVPTPVADPAAALTLDVPPSAYFGCVNTAAPIRTYPGRGARYAPTMYVACNTPLTVKFDIVDGVLVAEDGDRFQCTEQPKEFGDLETYCTRLED